MKNVFRKVYSYLSAGRPRKAMARILAVAVVFTTTYSLVLPAITKTIRLNGELDGVSVEVEAMSHAVPDGTELVLGPVLLPEDETENPSARRLTENEVRLIQEAALDGDETMQADILRALDISLLYNGNEIEPNDVVRLFLRSDLIRMASRPAIVHLTDSGEAELLEARDANGDVLLYGENFEDELEEIEVPIIPEEDYLLDADGNPVLDADGNPIKESEKDLYLWDEEGNLVLDENGNAVLKPDIPTEEDPVENPDVPPEEDPAGNPDQTGEGDEKAEPDTGNGEEGKEEQPSVSDGEDKNEKPSTDSEEGKEEQPSIDGSEDKEEQPPTGGNEDKEETPSVDNENKDGTSDAGSSGETSDIEDIKDKAEKPMPDGGEDKEDTPAADSNESKEEVSAPDTGNAPETDSGSSDSSSDGEASVETGSFSVYAIVDLTPKPEVPEEELLTFSGSAGEVDVYVTAPLTAFPEGATMELTLVDSEEVLETVSEAVGEQFSVVQAVDISFYDAEGTSIEPAEPISVVMRPQEAMDTENSKLVHIGETETSVVENAAFETEQVTFDSGEFSTYVIIITLGKPGEHVYKGDGVTVKVTYGSDAGLPEGTKMSIKELEKDTAEYQEYLEKTEKALNLDSNEISMENVSLEAQLDYLFGGGSKVQDARFYDISLEFAGEKIEPAAPVNVEIKYDDAEAVDAENLKIVHFADDGTEIIGGVNVETGDDGATITYQQKSFSITATTMASSYGNGGWINEHEGGRMVFYYANGQFELTYPKDKTNGIWVRPGQSGYPLNPSSAGILNKGTTVEEIIRALTVNTNNNQYTGMCKVVDFIMLDTYVVNSSNRAHNDAYLGQQRAFTEIWGEDIPADGNTKTIKITRGPGFNGYLLDLDTNGYPMQMNRGVCIDNVSSFASVPTEFDNNDNVANISQPVAIRVRDHSLLMMRRNSFITDSLSAGYGTGVLLTGSDPNTGGSLELFHQSYISKMAVGVEQENGKLRLKDSANPFVNNTVGVALHHGNSIGMWTDSISGITNSVPVFLREVGKWKSGDIVMDSGFKDEGQGQIKTNVSRNDGNKLVFMNSSDLNTVMGLEFNQGTGQKYYPVIQFRTGTVLNKRTGEWFATLYDAVNCTNPVKQSNAQRPGNYQIQSGDVLEFYGDTVEGKNIDINIDLTIQSSTSDAGHKDGFGNHQTSVLSGTTITIGNNATVTFHGGNGGLTLDGSGGTIITNNGTLHLENGVTLANAGKAVQQNGDFHLYDGVKFQNNNTDVSLPDKKVITLETTSANLGSTVDKIWLEEEEQYGGRDVVVAGEGNNNQLSESDLVSFKLQNKADYVAYIYNATGSDVPKGVQVLELKENGSGLVNVQVVTEDADGNLHPVPGASVAIDGKAYVTGENGFTDSVKYRAMAERVGNIMLTVIPDGYKDNKENRGTTVYNVIEDTTSSDGNFTLAEISDQQDGYVKNDNIHTFTIKLVPKTVPVTLWKRDAQDTKDLAGAVFTLNGKGDYTTSAEEGKVGKVSLGELTIGDYVLKETVAPEGYAAGEGTIQFAVKLGKDGELKVTGPGVETIDGNWTIKVTNNPRTVKIQVFKHGGNENIPLAGAEFTLMDEAGKVVETGTSDANGHLPVWEVVPGQSYTLTETKVPDGYLAVNKTQAIYVNEKGEILRNDQKISTDENGINVMKVMNNPGVPLPSTGGTGTWAYTAGGTALMLAAVCLLINRKKVRGRA